MSYCRSQKYFPSSCYLVIIISIMPQICWVVISPLALITVFVAGCVTWTRPSYGAVQYPEWAHTIGQSPPSVNCLLTTLSPGWLLFSLSVVQIPVWLVIMTLASVMEAGCGSWPTFRPTQSWTDRRQVRDDNDDDDDNANDDLLSRGTCPTPPSSARAARASLTSPSSPSTPRPWR